MRDIHIKIINVIFYLVVLLFLLDEFTSLDIKNQTIKSIVYVGILFLTPVVLIWNLVAIKNKIYRAFFVSFPTIVLIFILFLGPLKVLFFSGAWQTQTVLYRNENSSFKTIELQMQNLGALGYGKRTVEVHYLTSFFMITKKVQQNFENQSEWLKVDENINEREIK